MFRVVRGCVLVVCLVLAQGAAPESQGSLSDEEAAGVTITLSPAQPMNGKDAGGLGGIHKLQFVFASLVLASEPRPGQSPSEVLPAGPSFRYLRRYGVATFSGTETGGSVLVRFYFYSGYSYRFTCYVGLPSQGAPSAGAAAGMFGFKVAAKTSQGGTVKLTGLRASSVDGVGEPAMPLDGIVALKWDVAPQALPGAAAIEIRQEQKTPWSFHACTVLRRKA